MLPSLGASDLGDGGGALKISNFFPKFCALRLRFAIRAWGTSPPNTIEVHA